MSSDSVTLPVTSSSNDFRTSFLATPAQRKDRERIGWFFSHFFSGHGSIFFPIVVGDTNTPVFPTVRCTPVTLRQIHPPPGVTVSTRHSRVFKLWSCTSTQTWCIKKVLLKPLFGCFSLIVQLTQSNQFHYRRTAFYSQLKSKVGNILANSAALCINVNVDDSYIACRSHTHTSHSQTL
jgi:hypothetical protein